MTDFSSINNKLDKFRKQFKEAGLTDSKISASASYSKAITGRKLSPEAKEKLRQANLGRTMSDEAKAKAIAARTGKKQNISENSKRKRTDKTSVPINQYDLQGQFIKQFNSQMDAIRELDIERAKKNKKPLGTGSLGKALSHQQKSNGYYWRKAPYKDNIKDEIDALTGNKMKGQTRARAVLQFDLEGNLINEWPSAKVAGEVLKIYNANINICCRKNVDGGSYSYKGFVWQYLSA